jgi:hypothetical protein
VTIVGEQQKPLLIIFFIVLNTPFNAIFSLPQLQGCSTTPMVQVFRQTESSNISAWF